MAFYKSTRLRLCVPIAILQEVVKKDIMNIGSTFAAWAGSNPNECIP